MLNDAQLYKIVVKLIVVTEDNKIVLLLLLYFISMSINITSWYDNVTYISCRSTDIYLSLCWWFNFSNSKINNYSLTH